MQQDSMSFELRSNNSLRDSSYFFRIPRDTAAAAANGGGDGGLSSMITGEQQRWLYW